LDKFINDENSQHIEYHEHSYIIKKEFRDKYNNNDFHKEDSFTNNILDIKIIDEYFKEMFFNNIYKA